MEAHRSKTGFVPLVQGGVLASFVNPNRLDLVAPADPIPVADYVVGLELLGYRFEVYPDRRHGVTVAILNPEEAAPEGWHKHALALEYAFDRGTRKQKLKDFLIARDGSKENHS